jgi:endonuclease YncB( thermonuclease family)
LKSAAVVALVLVLLGALAACSSPPEAVPPIETPEPAPSPTGSIVRKEASPTPEEPAGVQARVVEVIDGDTIEVEIDGRVYTVRYLGVDCPEPCLLLRDSRRWSPE